MLFTSMIVLLTFSTMLANKAGWIQWTCFTLLLISAFIGAYIV